MKQKNMNSMRLSESFNQDDFNHVQRAMGGGGVHIIHCNSNSTYEYRVHTEILDKERWIYNIVTSNQSHLNIPSAQSCVIRHFE